MRSNKSFAFLGPLLPHIQLHHSTAITSPKYRLQSTFSRISLLTQCWMKTVKEAQEWNYVEDPAVSEICNHLSSEISISLAALIRKLGKSHQWYFFADCDLIFVLFRSKCSTPTSKTSTPTSPYFPIIKIDSPMESGPPGTSSRIRRTTVSGGENFQFLLYARILQYYRKFGRIAGLSQIIIEHSDRNSCSKEANRLVSGWHTAAKYVLIK